MSLWRRLKDDFIDFPATMSLGSVWVVVFLLMVVDQAFRPEGIKLGQVMLGLRNGHWFGDVKLVDLYQGEIWRALTATFVHYGLVHIGMNLYAMYQLGTLVESWYGSGPFLLIYLITGAGGNLLSGFVRHLLRSNPFIASGGGSTVIMGLVALCAIVGWFAGTRIGTHLRNQMIWVLLLTAGLGLGLTAGGLPVIDNWGHACGAFFGAVLGFAHPFFLAHSTGKLARALGWGSSLLIAGSGVALLFDDVADSRTDRARIVEQSIQRVVMAQNLIVQLDKVRTVYEAAAMPNAIRRGFAIPTMPPQVRPPGPLLPDPADASPDQPSNPVTNSAATTNPFRGVPANQYLSTLTALRLLDAMAKEIGAGTAARDYQSARSILIDSLKDRPTLEEIHEFDDRLRSIALLLQRDRDAAYARAIAYGFRPTGPITAQPAPAR